jgi:hypothetical protein
MEPTGKVYDYFQRALRRPRSPLAPGTVWRGDEEGCMAGFQIRLERGRIVGVEYRSTTCATLVALCEHLTELTRGMTVAEALNYSPQNLLALHPEIPAGRRARADLAVRALHAGFLSLASG